MNLAAITHLITILAVIAACVILSCVGKLTGDTALVSILSTAGISLPAQVLAVKAGS